MIDPRTEPSSLLALLRERFDDVLARIEELVNIDSGSFTTEGVNRVADLCHARFELGGWDVERHRHVGQDRAEGGGHQRVSKKMPEPSGSG